MVINEGLKMEQWLILPLCESTRWQLIQLFSMRMHFCQAHGHLEMCTTVQARMHVYVCGCVCFQIRRVLVKDYVSYRCKLRTSGYHISNAQKGMRVGAKPQRRAVPQSLNSGGIVGGDQDCITTAYTCSLHDCLPTSQYSSTTCSWSATAIHRKWQQAKNADIWSQSRPKQLISSERGIPDYALSIALSFIIFIAKAHHWLWENSYSRNRRAMMQYWRTETKREVIWGFLRN